MNYIKEIKQLVADSFHTVCEEFSNGESAINLTFKQYDIKVGIFFDIDRGRAGIDSYSKSQVYLYHDGRVTIELGESLDGSDVNEEFAKYLHHIINKENFDITTYKHIEITNTLYPFSEAIKALELGKRVRRIGWKVEDKFIFRQVPSEIPSEVVGKMTSLPQSVKDYFISTFEDSNISSIKYSNQIALVCENNEIINWSPIVIDIMSEDWLILD